MTNDPNQGGPWYQYFWPWFIVILLGTTVVAGISTVYIAISGADPLVNDDYYSEGKAINRTFEAEQEASIREATARVSTGEGVAIRLDILGEAPAALELELSHVTHAERDVLLHLERVADGSYHAREDLPTGGFYATLRPAGKGTSWRLRRRVQLPYEGEFLFDSNVEPSG